MKFDIKDYPGKYLMHCASKQEGDMFTKYLHECGRKWIGGRSYLNNSCWNSVHGGTTYRFNYGTCCDLDWYKTGPEYSDYEFLEFSDFEWNWDEMPVEVADTSSFDAMLSLL